MPLLAGHRRLWTVFVIVALSLPMVRQISSGGHDGSSGAPKRPAPPATSPQWIALPATIDAFLAENFGFRTQLVHANALLRYKIASSTDRRVTFGRDGWLFLTIDHAIEQSTGRHLRVDRMEAFADAIAGFHRELLKHDIKLIAAFPPNNSTISRAHLPWWAAEAPATTEYDLIIKALAQRNVPSVDLRAPLRAAGPSERTYFRKNSHWNLLGALIAYDAIVDAAGLPGWSYDLGRVFKGYDRIVGGDLARLIGVSDDVEDVQAHLDLSSYSGPDKVLLSGERQATDDITTGRPGPTVLIMGDSFTRLFFRPFFSLRVGRLIWMPSPRCDLKVPPVVAQKPQLVIIAPTERYMGC
jgi:hypothetical protein